MAKKTHEEMCYLALAIKELQIKTMLTFHLTPVRIATIKNTTTSLGEDVGKRNHYTFLIGM
jgi:hypothetical protein